MTLPIPSMYSIFTYIIASKSTILPYMDPMGYAEQCGAQYDGRNWAAFLEISVSSFCLKKDGMPVQLDGQN